MTDSDSFLPFSVGRSWSFEVTDLTTFEVTTKTQVVSEEIAHPVDGLPVLVQVTTKPSGRVESWFRSEGTQLRRLQETLFDEVGAFKSLSVFDPFKLRLDETPERLTQGATYTEAYTEIEQDQNGTPLSTVSKSEAWEVLDADIACPGEAFADLRCVHLRRVRTSGGVGDKQFWYSRGVGKIREEGGQVEQLTSCAVGG